jgi:hypothetical protein
MLFATQPFLTHLHACNKYKSQDESSVIGSGAFLRGQDWLWPQCNVKVWKHMEHDPPCLCLRDVVYTWTAMVQMRMQHMQWHRFLVARASNHNGHPYTEIMNFKKITIYWIFCCFSHYFKNCWMQKIKVFPFNIFFLLPILLPGVAASLAPPWLCPWTYTLEKGWQKYVWQIISTSYSLLN